MDNIGKLLTVAEFVSTKLQLDDYRDRHESLTKELTHIGVRINELECDATRLSKIINEY